MTGTTRPRGDGPPAATVTVRPYASPLPLGFFSFGIGMALLAGSGLGQADRHTRPPQEPGIRGQL
ncbi:hypothetical protein ACF09J_28335 [Streptomyces sp. NPDC014889]|uniref:hypothetical protein n=1 Tax=Streptomyces sp. NPDC014889 TaxID=3364928 RepID=UPI00370342D6